MGNEHPNVMQQPSLPPKLFQSRRGLRGTLLNWHRFDGQRWSLCEGGHSPSARETSFKLITFNVWFAPHRQATRTEELVRVILREDADFVCLQEATAKFLSLLLAAPEVRARYVISSPIDQFEALNAATGYDSFMLCKPQWRGERLMRFQLTSVYGRCFYLSLSPLVNVGTIHLESVANQRKNRATQMAEIYDVLEEYGVLHKAFFCGDLNHCLTQGENHLNGASIDVWPLLRPGEDGWTENAEVNLMLASKVGAHPKVRFDRIVLTGAETGFDAREVRILGDEEIAQFSALKEVVDANLAKEVFVSDHFGLVAGFHVKNF